MHTACLETLSNYKFFNYEYFLSSCPRGGFNAGACIYFRRDVSFLPRGINRTIKYFIVKCDAVMWKRSFVITIFIGMLVKTKYVSFCLLNLHTSTLSFCLSNCDCSWSQFTHNTSPHYTFDFTPIFLSCLSLAAPGRRAVPSTGGQTQSEEWSNSCPVRRPSAPTRANWIPENKARQRGYATELHNNRCTTSWPVRIKWIDHLSPVDFAIILYDN